VPSDDVGLTASGLRGEVMLNGRRRQRRGYLLGDRMAELCAIGLKMREKKREEGREKNRKKKVGNMQGDREEVRSRKRKDVYRRLFKGRKGSRQPEGPDGEGRGSKKIILFGGYTGRVWVTQPPGEAALREYSL